ncbi:hypothetical protein PV797_19960 [Clostridiaceae bacterium M8S5]|nr:hypothetical protein PV797_19960 [Clostridiaceae bacterium M8S5]
MFRDTYRSMNEQIIPDSKLVNKVIHAKKKSIKTNKIKNFFLKPVAICAISLLIVLTVTPVIADNVSGIYNLMYFVSPSVAQYFMPVRKTCEDNGIIMEVVSSYIHDNTAEIYITLKDLKGNRIDETTDLNDSYSINRAFDSSATCRLVAYDTKTKTATFMITIKEWGNKKIVGDKITFSVREFISNKHEYNEIPIEMDLKTIGEAKSTKYVSTTGGGGTKYREYITDKDEIEVLTPATPMKFPVKDINLTGIGYMDGMLHIQTSVINNLEKDNHGYFFLVDKNLKKINDTYRVGFMEKNIDGNRVDYDEYVFDIPKSKIDQCSLYGTFFISNTFTKGDWQVTFRLEEQCYD